jgi:hypothetical protein
MFQILDDFVKKECSPGDIAWNSDAEHKEARQKMNELLAWWHGVYLKFNYMEGYDKTKATPLKDKLSEVKRGDLVYYKVNSNEYDIQFNKTAFQRETELEKMLILKLKELVDLRSFLWT